MMHFSDMYQGLFLACKRLSSEKLICVRLFCAGSFNSASIGVIRRIAGLRARYTAFLGIAKQAQLVLFLPILEIPRKVRTNRESRGCKKHEHCPDMQLGHADA